MKLILRDFSHEQILRDFVMKEAILGDFVMKKVCRCVSGTNVGKHEKGTFIFGGDHFYI